MTSLVSDEGIGYSISIMLVEVTNLTITGDNNLILSLNTIFIKVLNVTINGCQAKCHDTILEVTPAVITKLLVTIFVTFTVVAIVMVLTLGISINCIAKGSTISQEVIVRSLDVLGTSHHVTILAKVVKITSFSNKAIGYLFTCCA